MFTGCNVIPVKYVSPSHGVGMSNQCLALCQCLTLRCALCRMGWTVDRVFLDHRESVIMMMMTMMIWQRATSSVFKNPCVSCNKFRGM